MAALFTAADLTGLSTNVTSVLVAFIGISLIFVGNRYLKKSGIRA